MAGTMLVAKVIEHDGHPLLVIFEAPGHLFRVPDGLSVTNVYYQSESMPVGRAEVELWITKRLQAHFGGAITSAKPTEDSLIITGFAATESGVRRRQLSA